MDAALAEVDAVARGLAEDDGVATIVGDAAIVAAQIAIIIAIAIAVLTAREAFPKTRRIEEIDQAFLAVLLVNAWMRSRMSGPTPGFLYTSYDSPAPSESPSVSISRRLFAR